MTTMVRFRRVAQLWDWLPAFRGVAEHESLQRAASALGVSASALSRTVKLLEEALGASLFERHPGGLRLTKLGTELLGITRDAMRLVDDCIAAHEARGGRAGALVLGATSEPLLLVVAGCLPVDGAPQPFALRLTTDAALDEDLLQGNVDIVATLAPPSVGAAAPGLVVETIGELCRGVYASSRHPLAARARAGALGAADLAGERFVASDDSASFAPVDRVAVYAGSEEAAKVVCERSTLLAVLPDVVARASVGLVRLGDAEGAPSLSVVRRAPAAGRAESPALAALVRALRDALRKTGTGTPRSSKARRDT